MATTQANPQERIARERLTTRPFFLGVDGAGGVHYWDSYERALVIVEDGTSEKVELSESPFTTLGEWCEYTRRERGWTTGPRVGGSLVKRLVQGVDV